MVSENKKPTRRRSSREWSLKTKSRGRELIPERGARFLNKLREKSQERAAFLAKL